MWSDLQIMRNKCDYRPTSQCLALSRHHLLPRVHSAGETAKICAENKAGRDTALMTYLAFHPVKQRLNQQAMFTLQYSKIKSIHTSTALI